MKLAAPSEESRAVERPRFRERQPLQAADLTAEQAYLIGMRRRHAIGEHAWGIVRGLALAAAGPRLVVQPGFAVDGYGRELVVPAAIALSDDAMRAVGSRWVAVWLLYGRLADTPSQPGRWSCGPGRNSRWREEPCLRLTRAEGGVDPLEPPGLDATALGFGPDQEPPDASAPVWPVYLGRVERREGRLRVDLAGRPYCGAVGELVVDPRGGARLRVGADSGGVGIDTADETGALRERIAFRPDGTNEVTGPVRLSGDLAVADGTDAFGVELRPLAAPPAAAAPWQLYRTAVTENGRTIRELRAEIGNPGDDGDPTRYALTVGQVERLRDVRRTLTVLADCTVLVDGDLDVKGLVVEGPVQLDASDPRFGGAVLAAWTRGVASGALALDTTYAGALEFDRVALAASSLGKVTWSFRVHNTGGVRLEDITVSGRVVASGRTVFDKQLDDPFALEPGKTHGIHGTFQLGSARLPGSVKITITAIGLGPAGAPAQAVLVRRVPLEEVLL
jgi:hypothetical protein